MTSVSVERLDHLRVIAEVIKDLSRIDMIDARLGPEAQEVITPGEAVTGMVLNGLGFANRPLSLTPQFFANKPLDLLFHEGVRAEAFNRFKLGCTLNKVYTYGCDRLFSELALAICAHEGVELRFNHLDTTSFALTGEYVPDGDEQAITITHGYSRDHRPALKQAVLELMVSQDGGVPFVSQSWDGNASDTQIFQERAQALISDADVIRAYKAQGQVEGGFRCLKDPLVFVSSLFVKNPSRLQGLLTVMTIALLVYSVAQRRLRHQLARQHASVPNQINQPTPRPTLRWVFQLLEGIHRVRVRVQSQIHDLIEGLNGVKINILRLFGEGVCRLYQISPV